MRAHLVVVAPPLLYQDLGLAQEVEDLAVRQLVTGSGVWADTACRSRKNEKRIARAGLISKIHFRRSPGKALPERHERANAARSKVRAHVEHPFAEQKDRMRLFVRTIGIARTKAKIGVANPSEIGRLFSACQVVSAAPISID